MFAKASGVVGSLAVDVTATTLTGTFVISSSGVPTVSDTFVIVKQPGYVRPVGTYCAGQAPGGLGKRMESYEEGCEVFSTIAFNCYGPCRDASSIAVAVSDGDDIAVTVTVHRSDAVNKCVDIQDATGDTDSVAATVGISNIGCVPFIVPNSPADANAIFPALCLSNDRSHAATVAVDSCHDVPVTGAVCLSIRGGVVDVNCGTLCTSVYHTVDDGCCVVTSGTVSVIVQNGDSTPAVYVPFSNRVSDICSGSTNPVGTRPLLATRNSHLNRRSLSINSQ